jgi:hypothetical protein
MISLTKTVMNMNTFACIVSEKGIEPMVGLNATEAHRSESSMKGLVPNSTSLLEAIERFPEPTNMIWSALLKSLRLLHVDLFLL